MLKTTTADKHFSKCIRLRSNWKCEFCGLNCEHDKKNLHCSHYIPRGNKLTRHFPFNAFAHCRNCHLNLGGGVLRFKGQVIERSAHPSLFHKHYCDVFGADVSDNLLDFSNLKFHNFKHWEKDISDHYREEAKRIEALRMDGEMGRIEIEPWLGTMPLNLWEHYKGEAA